MYMQHFTEAARQVIVLAREEARALGHDHVGTGHILLGLLREHESVGARTLLESDADCQKLPADVVEMLAQARATTRRPRPPTAICRFWASARSGS